ncbi:hypothetical protein Sru01_07270 [Sphaerisporangium rufum]|uniref:Uncharacterized protein n=1 Tax=Sphaerisporangium rufum TaxID=1381558 RepID=A0A919QZN0_9ACTN|nr:hypothetical protein [Sphaerisporangium rufum]GII75745.1 hypothetical protein Sru01_07270 [Sphaerisporangium rufum]
MSDTRAASLRLIAPGLALIVAGEAAVLAARALGGGTTGFTWLVAALVAGFSLSGSV